ncbi:hypothetical protein G6M85_11590 [Agrobacterium tumefaciens]|uniref:alpha/beta hydrolase family protein n=1 Tax=Agrobacterium tumefaciens TaxID=358 RepID=UPI001572596C|nr:hypothetical protein [Agrobacterium tumefaciens]NTE66250.1 hypothetical protein [Agrobacterium tumefaciens]
MVCSRPGPSDAARSSAAGLFPNELLLDGANFPAIVYWRPPAGTNPTVIFLPGGGHLARVAYGHPGAHAPDFVDFWLREVGWGLLAISYPSDHSAFSKVYPDMTVSDWGASVADIAVDLLADRAAPHQIIVAGWSMAGRAARSVCNELTRVGLPPVGFISLAASAPFPGLVPVLEKGEPLTEAGLWDLAASEFGLPSRETKWCAELAVQSAENGREVIPVEIYKRDYRANTPLLLRGEPQFVRTSGAVQSVAEVAQELGTFDYASHPLTGVIAPTKPSDARHALTDALTWGFLNAQQLFEHLVKGGRDLSAISPERWERLRLLMLDLPQRLTRTVAGGHFFFIGALGAEATARLLIDLSRDIASLQAEISALISEAPQLSSSASDQ